MLPDSNSAPALAGAVVARSQPIGGLRRERLRRLLKLEVIEIVVSDLTPAHESRVTVGKGVVTPSPVPAPWLALFVARAVRR